MLQVVDSQWKDHLLGMDHLKEGIGLRGYGQKDPLVEYKKESFKMFEVMMDRIESETVKYLWLMQVLSPGEEPHRREEEAHLQEEAKLAFARRRARQPDGGVCPRRRAEKAARAGRHALLRRRGLGCPPAHSPRRKKSVATSPAPAAPARSTRNAAAQRPDPQGPKAQSPPAPVPLPAAVHLSPSRASLSKLPRSCPRSWPEAEELAQAWTLVATSAKLQQVVGRSTQRAH